MSHLSAQLVEHFDCRPPCCSATAVLPAGAMTAVGASAVAVAVAVTAAAAVSICCT